MFFVLNGCVCGSEGETLVEKVQRDDVFSSTSKLNDLVEHEAQIVDLLDTFATYTIEKAKLIKA